MQRVSAWMRTHEFLLRRLHSLSGVIPIGFFLIEHLYTNSMAYLGPEKFNEHVRWLHNLPYLFALELLFIFIPIAFHGIYGIYIALTGRPNVGAYPYLDNWRYTLQRVTGYVAFVFILAHLMHFRFAHWFGGTKYLGHEDPFWLTWQGFVNLWLPAPVVSAVYAIGLASAVFHLCNGMTTFCITWGITVGDVARKRVGVAFAGLGVVMFVWGALSIRAFMTHEAGATRTHEDARVAARAVGPGGVQRAVQP